MSNANMVHPYRESYENYGKTFSNKELFIKIIICLNCCWQPKVTAIYESKELATMDTNTFFKKLEEHEMELKILAIDEEGEKKNESLAFKVDESDSDGDMAFIVESFKKFMKNETTEKRGERKRYRKNTIHSNML